MAKKEKKQKQKKGKRFDFVTLFLVLILIAGIVVMVYPSACDFVNARHRSNALAVYENALEDKTTEDYDAMLKEASEFNEYLAGKGSQWSLSEADEDWYNSILNVNGLGIIGTVEIPSINVTLPIYHGTSDEILQIGAGHLVGTSFPVGGTGTHAVISGHRGLVTARLFTDLDKVAVGDMFYITVLDRELAYEVDQILVVLPEDTSAIEIDPEGDYVTLMTCTPYGVNTHRLLVRGHRVDLPESGRVANATGEATVISGVLVAPFIAVPILVILLIIVLVMSGRRRHHAK